MLYIVVLVHQSHLIRKVGIPMDYKIGQFFFRKDVKTVTSLSRAYEIFSTIKYSLIKFNTE